jgi:hypothetical protein
VIPGESRRDGRTESTYRLHWAQQSLPSHQIPGTTKSHPRPTGHWDIDDSNSEQSQKVAYAGHDSGPAMRKMMRINSLGKIICIVLVELSIVLIVIIKSNHHYFARSAIAVGKFAKPASTVTFGTYVQKRMEMDTLSLPFSRRWLTMCVLTVVLKRSSDCPEGQPIGVTD